MLSCFERSVCLYRRPSYRPACFGFCLVVCVPRTLLQLSSRPWRGHWRGPEHKRDGDGAAASRYAAAVCPCRGGGPTATKDAADVANASRGRGRWQWQEGQAQAWPGLGPGRRNRAWLLPHWGAAARRFKRGGGRSAACCGRPYGRPKQEEGRPDLQANQKGLPRWAKTDDAHPGHLGAFVERGE